MEANQYPTDSSVSSQAGQSVYSIVTEQIIKQLESGVVPWKRPWTTRIPRNLMTQKAYRGLNVFLLAVRGFGSPYWLTYNQANKLGGHIRKGEHGQIITYWQIGKYEKQDLDSGEMESHKSILLRYYRVFNLEQTEGIADKLGLVSSVRTPNLDECERIVSEMPNPPKYEQSHRAWYRPACDTVGIPSKPAFSSPEAYYATLFHELTHSTGHSSRVGREGIEQLNKFGDELYSKEELIAELGSAFLCGQAGISPAVIDNSAAYLQSWINVLKGDSKLIVSAASQAQKASDYILARQGE